MIHYNRLCYDPSYDPDEQDEVEDDFDDIEEDEYDEEDDDYGY